MLDIKAIIIKAIVEFKIGHLKRNAVIEFFHNFMERVEDCQSVKTNLKRYYEALRAAANELFRWAELTRKSNLTDPIMTLDSQRDIFWTAIEHAVNAQTKSLDQDIRNKAIAVQNKMNSLKVDKNSQYQQESGALDTILSALLGSLQPEVTAIGVLPLINQVKEVNDEMHRLLTERSDENMLKPAGAFENARRDAEYAYRFFVMMVNAYWAIKVMDEGQADPELELFIKRSNQLIEDYNRTQFPGTSKPNTGSGDSGNGDNTGSGDTGNQQPGDNGTQQPDDDPNNPENSEGSENNPSNPGTPGTPGTPSNPSNPNSPTDPDDDPDALKPGPGGDDPDL